MVLVKKHNILEALIRFEKSVQLPLRSAYHIVCFKLLRTQLLNLLAASWLVAGRLAAGWLAGGLAGCWLAGQYEIRAPEYQQ